MGKRNNNNNGMIHGIVLIFLCLVALAIAGVSSALEPFLEREAPLPMFKEAPTVNFMAGANPRIIALISAEAVDGFCSSIEPNETFIMVSRGGNIVAGMRLGKCLAEANANLIVVMAQSMAPIVALHAQNVCLTEVADIAVHQPGYGPTELMPRSDMLKYYGYIQRQAIENGVPKMAVDMYLAYADQSLNITTIGIPRPVFAAMLGARFKGVCNMGMEDQIGLRNFIAKRYP